MRVLIVDDMKTRLDVFAHRYREHDITLVTNAEDAIRALDEPKDPIELVQLDHDLSEEHYEAFHSDGGYVGGTGMDVVDYIIALKPEDRPKFVIIHSWNSVRAPVMVMRLRDHGVRSVWQKFNPHDVCPIADKEDKVPTTKFPDIGTALGAVRHWIQWHVPRGDEVTWGSQDVLAKTFTVSDLEYIAQRVYEDLKRDYERSVAPPMYPGKDE